VPLCSNSATTPPPTPHPAGLTTARRCPLVLPAHYWGDGEGAKGAPGPTCTNTGPVTLNATRKAAVAHYHDDDADKWPSSPPSSDALQRWAVRLPPWAPPGAALPGRLLTVQVRRRCSMLEWSAFITGMAFLSMLDQRFPGTQTRCALQAVGRAATACKSMLAAPLQCADVCSLYFTVNGDPAAVWLLEAVPGGRYLLRAQVGSAGG